MGDDDLARIHHHTGIAHANRHLAAQRLVARAEHVAECPRAVKPRDLRQLLVQRPYRQVIHMRHGRPQRNQPLAARLAEHLIDDAAAGDQFRPLDLGNIRGRRSEYGRLVDVEAGLRARTDHALIFEIGVCLQHRGVADTQLSAHLAYRRHALTGAIYAAPNIFGKLLGNALIEQQIGHLAGLLPTEP